MPDQVLQEIKDRLNLAEVISGYIQIKKAGVNFKAVCPFHNEKTPSLVISPQKQIWHCFGCGEGGDVFEFIKKYENADFKDALKILADKAGVKLPEYHPKDQAQVSEEELLHRINDFAARFYHEILTKNPAGKEALDYLKRRGLTTDTIKQWQLGYAPNEFHALESALIKKNVPLDALIKAGVSAKNERGQMYDRFRGRITFPIFNSFGQVVGFSARILEASANAAKYVNSPETAIYSKSKTLFGFNFAKGDIRKKDEVIIVEGQMDCISAHQAGFVNTVASSGTALTEYQLLPISRLTKNLKFCFDADAAGLAATRRAISLYLGKDFIIKIVDLAGAKDPDELIKENPKKFVQLVAEAPLFLDYYIEKAFTDYSDASVEQKKTIAREILPLVKLLTDPLEQDHYIQLLARKFSTSPAVLKEALNKAKTAARQAARAALGEDTNRPREILPEEKEIVGGMALYPKFLAVVAENGKLDDFPSSEIRGILEPVFGGSGNVDVAGSSLAKEGVFMVELRLTEMGNEKALVKYLKKSFAALRLSTLRRQQKEIAAQIAQAEKEKAKQKLAALQKTFAELAKQRSQFEQILEL